MKQLSAILRFPGVLLRRPSWALKNFFHFTNDSSCRLHVERKYGLRNGLPAVDLLDLILNTTETLDPYSFLDGASRPTDLMLLRAIARRTPQGRYMEFGTWRGESLANVAPVIAEAWGMTFGEEAMRAYGTSESAIRAANCFTRGIPNMKLIEANTQTYDFRALEGKFDVVFIDADHEYPGVTIDTRTAFKLLRDERSVIVWHDYGKNYETINWQVLRGILDGAPSDEHRKHIYHVTNSLCAIYTNEAVRTYNPEPSVPDKKFTLQVRAERFTLPAR